VSLDGRISKKKNNYTTGGPRGKKAGKNKADRGCMHKMEGRATQQPAGTFTGRREGKLLVNGGVKRVEETKHSYGYQNGYYRVRGEKGSWVKRRTTKIY